MPDVAISASAVMNAGDGYTVPDYQDFVLRAARVSYDGSGAAGSFVPVLQIVSDAGLVVAECPLASTLAAGASADVSWFPGVSQAASAGGSGIQFDTYPQAGQWLYVETDGPATSPSGYGVEVFDDSGNGIDLGTGSGGQILLHATGGGDIVLQSGGAVRVASTPIILQALPTSPGVPGALWVDSSGYLRVS